jgi:predicted ATPase/class 3 adenylate cyclase/DNA-binding XRE family transcriptional regulator
LRALREARGVTQEGWAAQLGVGRRTVQRWERGEIAPDPTAEAALMVYCRDRALFRSFDHGPLAHVAVTPEWLQSLLVGARLRDTVVEDPSLSDHAEGLTSDDSARNHRQPRGTVTMLFSDIEGSTRLLLQLGDRYADLLATHCQLLRTVFAGHHGYEVDTQGDAFFVAFARATEAVAAAIAMHRTLAAHPWPDGALVRIRIGLHTGEPRPMAAGYAGIDVHRAARICAAGHGGQVLVSESTATLVEPELPAGVTLSDLGRHRLKDLPLPERLFQLNIPDLPASFPALRSLDVRPNNLPIELSSFIGRDGEMGAVKQQLTRTRLLTLIGSGGVGKTRLALQVAAELLAQQADGVWLVDLGPITDPALVPQATAAVLGVREQPGRPLLEALIEALRTKQSLLVLDNCEHLVAACARLAHLLLQACPSLTIVVTSREMLGVAGEMAYRVPSLTLPDQAQGQPLSELARYEAVRLFVERAVAMRPDFALTESNAATVADVCRRLDGIPLAIELAAARVRALSVEQLAARLDDRFRLLSGSSRTALPRQQTLKATIDWSFDLLSGAEQRALRRLAVFSGGCGLEAAEAICAEDDQEANGVLELLTRLSDKSLVLVEEHEGESRYRLLETIRQYGRDRLVEAGEAVAVRDRHRDWALAVAECAEPLLWGREQERWLARLEVEHDNLRAALDWTIDTEQTETALRLTGALWKFWEVRGYLTEGRTWLARALGQGSASSVARAKACAGAGVLARHQGDYEHAGALLQEGLALCRAEHDRRGVAAALNNLGIVARRQGEFKRAQTLLAEGLELRRELGDEHGIAGSLHNLGVLARHRGQYPSATTLLEECLAARRTLGDNQGIANTLNNLGNVARLQGDLERATTLLTEGLLLDRELMDPAGIAFGLDGLAAVACMRGAATRAAQLFGAADVLRERIGAPLSPIDRAEHHDAVADARRMVGDDAFAGAYAEGRALSLAAAVALASEPANATAE